MNDQYWVTDRTDSQSINPPESRLTHAGRDALKTIHGQVQTALAALEEARALAPELDGELDEATWTAACATLAAEGILEVLADECSVTL